MFELKLTLNKLRIAALNIEQFPSKEVFCSGKASESVNKATVKASESIGDDIDQNDVETKV